MKKFLKSHKRIVIGVITLIILLTTFLLYYFVFRDEAKYARKEKELTKELEIMGKDFYENYLYPQIEKSVNSTEELNAVLIKFKDTGIKADLNILGRYNNKVNSEKISKFINLKTKEECKKETSLATIYPKEGYGKTDYIIKVELDCGY